MGMFLYKLRDVSAKSMEMDFFCNAEISEFLLNKFDLLGLNSYQNSRIALDVNSMRARREKNVKLEMGLLGQNIKTLVVVLFCKWRDHKEGAIMLMASASFWESLNRKGELCC